MPDILMAFELQTLCFPLLVVLLACISFPFGGQCALWQWWTAVAIVIGAPFLRGIGWRAAIGAATLFLFLLFAIKCLLPPLSWDNAALDMLFYHLPMAQLLAEGWNPVTDPLAEGICISLGLDPWGMAPVHVAFLFKPMAVFAAVSSKFVHDPHGLTLSGICLLWLGCVLPAIRYTRGNARWPALLAFILVLPLVFSRMFVDLAMAFVSCGLLFTMARCLQKTDSGHCRISDTPSTTEWVHLLVYTIWMASIKLNGVFAAFVFWVLFALAICRRDRQHLAFWIGRFALLSAIAAVLWLAISWKAIVTSWKNYGHPLYPCMTTNPTMFPKQDFTWDLRVVNEDFRSLGKPGTWLYEYVSPSLGTVYGKLKTGRADFKPRRLFYEEQCMNGKIRLLVWSVFVLLLLHPRGRLWGLGGLLLTFLVPNETIGYHRYQPWFSSLGCLAIALWSERPFSKTSARWKHALRFMATICLVALVTTWMWRHARDVDFKLRERTMARDYVRCRVCKAGHQPCATVNPDDFARLYNFSRAFDNQCKLLILATGHAENTTLLSIDGWSPDEGWDLDLSKQPLWKWDEGLWFAPEEEKPQMTIRDLGTPWREASVWDEPEAEDGVELWTMTPFGRYYVPWDANASHIRDYYLRGAPLPGENRWARLFRRSKYFLHVWLRMYPSEVWHWLTGKHPSSLFSGKAPGESPPGAPSDTREAATLL